MVKKKVVKKDVIREAMDRASKAADEKVREVRRRDAEDLGYPPALAKACDEPYDYAMMLTTGILEGFSMAEPVNTEWVHLDLLGGWTDVRLDQIVWVRRLENL